MRKRSYGGQNSSGLSGLLGLWIRLKLKVEMRGSEVSWAAVRYPDSPGLDPGASYPPPPPAREQPDNYIYICICYILLHLHFYWHLHLHHPHLHFVQRRLHPNICIDNYTCRWLDYMCSAVRYPYKSTFILTATSASAAQTTSMCVYIILKIYLYASHQYVKNICLKSTSRY